MKGVLYIKLTKGENAIIDVSDINLIRGMKWHVAGSNGYLYAWTKINRKNVSMHRFLVGAKQGEYVDHINGNGLDNRRDNLRVCTHAQNMANSKLPSNNTSGYKGVSFDKSRNKYRAKIKKDKKDIWIGRFKSKEEAALAYNKKAIELFGDFAKLNKIL